VGAIMVLLATNFGLSKQTESSPSLAASPATSSSFLDKSADHLLSPSSAQGSSDFIPAEARRAAAEGNAAFAQGKIRQAVRAYQEVLQLAPNNLVGLVNLGVAEYRLGESASAEKHLKRALSLRLETGTAWLALGTMYMDQGRLDEALAALTQARVYEPKDARVHNYLGVVMNRMGWSDAAESELRTAVELDTTYCDAHYNLAIAYMDRNPPAIELAKRHYYIALQCGAPRDASMEKSFKGHFSSPKFSQSAR